MLSQTRRVENKSEKRGFFDIFNGFSNTIMDSSLSQTQEKKGNIYGENTNLVCQVLATMASQGTAGPSNLTILCFDWAPLFH